MNPVAGWIRLFGGPVSAHGPPVDHCHTHTTFLAVDESTENKDDPNEEATRLDTVEKYSLQSVYS